ncbi:MAG TPA: hypothetical protein VFY03_10485 [Woeseiaceae bacterium]|nr:hypothetical protein [Woeseiaceae bacterium]
MDALIAAASRALAAGDPLGALKRVALRDDPAALALRGIAMAQLGDFDIAKALLKRAGRAFGSREPVARARCIVAEAEIALASRDLGWPATTLDAARATLETHGDHLNAAHAEHIEAQRHLLMGRLIDAERILARIAPATLPPALQAAHELLVFGCATRRLDTGTARAALGRAKLAARAAGNPALAAEVENAFAVLEAPAARLHRRGSVQTLRLAEVEALFAGQTLIVDACRHRVRGGDTVVSLMSRPVLFGLARALGEAWPKDVARDALIARVFRTRRSDDTHRARLRVEMGRLRTALKPLAAVRATPTGFELAPNEPVDVAVLAWPAEEAHAEVLALLADGEAWSTSALALALGASQRSVQRALGDLAAAGRVQAYGRSRARRWVTAPLPGFTTTLLLPGPLPGD